MLGYAAYRAASGYFAGFGEPLCDRHAFRQTQTALSTYWILHGGGLLAYETPVFGAPYSAPFEFPLYQWIVALVHLVTRMSLDLTGPRGERRILRRNDRPVLPRPAAIRGVGGLGAPRDRGATCGPRIHLLDAGLSHRVDRASLSSPSASSPSAWPSSRDPRWTAVSRGSAASASLGALVKVTTAFGYMAALGIVWRSQFLRNKERRGRISGRKRGVLRVGVRRASGTRLPASTWYADHEKALNPMTANYITSADAS